MDNIINPTQRKWISPKVHLGTFIEELKRVVRLQKDELLIIDPVPLLAGGSTNANDEDVQDKFESAFMQPDTSSFNFDDVSSTLRSESERPEENETRKRDKWAEDDSACEAAVAAVGGGNFFLFGKKALKDDKSKRHRGRKAKAAVEADSDESCVNDSSGSSRDKTGDKSGERLVDSTMYEQYNYDQEEQGNEDSADFDKQLQNMISADAEELRRIKTSIPEALNESDAEDDTDWLEYDNDFDNFTGVAQRLEDMKEMIDASSDSDEENDFVRFESSSDEEGENVTKVASDGCVNDGEIPCSSQSILKQSTPPTSLRSALFKGGNTARPRKNVRFVLPNPQDEGEEWEKVANVATDGCVNDGEIPCSSKSIWKQPTLLRSALFKGGDTARQRKNVRFVLPNPQDEGESLHSLGPSTSQSETATDGGGIGNTESTSHHKIDNDTNADPTLDFKRFSDWVFNQNNKRDREIKESIRPKLMERLGLVEKDARTLQSLTSANLTSVHGEVFQDDPVLQSSSMPLLAPPTNVFARTTLQSLAIFLTHGEDPSIFPWKSINVQQQMNDDFLNHQSLKQMEQQKLDVTNPAMKDLLVDKEDDFLLQILIYQNTDPEDVLQDEVKFRHRLSSNTDNIAAVNLDHKGKGGRKCRGPAPGEEDYGPTSGQNRSTRDWEPKLAYELHMLGSQTVKDLMKAFHCENDYVSLKDIPHPDSFNEDPAHYAKSHFPCSMILINDTIYCDPNSEVDYISIINEWAEKRPEKHIGPFRRGDWNSKLRDLTVSFGFPYVYIHLGGCEHIYVITKARLLHLEDDHLLKNYPKIVGMTRFKSVYCRVDNEYLARWAVLDYKEFPENPMLLCTECVLMYCYDKHKKKRGDFKLYPFTQLANIL